MPSLKVFTSSRLKNRLLNSAGTLRLLHPFSVPGLILLSLGLTACVSLDDSSSAPVSSVPDGPSDQYVGSPVNSEVTVLDPAMEVIVPEVKGATAAEFERAVALMRSGRLEEAEPLLLGITEQQPELAGPWINLGQVYVALDRLDEARRAFEAAIAANPMNCTAYNELGLMYRQIGEFETAEQHYLSCIERVPGHGPSYLNLGILNELYLGRLTEALGYYRRYQSLQDEPDRRVQGWVMDLERRLGV